MTAEPSSGRFPDILRTGSMLDRGADLVDDTPRQLGPYRILERIGEGGMGIVYLAEQGAPLVRRVAIKLARTAVRDGRALARFEYERQTLAVMNHPNIARVFDAGSAPDSRPYFVMEHVAGESITAFCDTRQLGIEPRLELFLRICDGVQHAHVNAVIHRDLKPSNILVTTESGPATPKIIDFGVAKALQNDAGPEKGLTQFGQIVGTPEYMSPEQAALDGRPADTRTDVYSLGVVLYELLVGSRPFERKSGTGESFVDLCRRIREDEPERPSTRATRASDATVARARGLLPVTLARRLRGDLDAIAMKALAKEPEGRYATPLDMAADLERHLSHRPIGARPPSMLIRFRKSLRRHRASWALSVTLVAFAALGTIQALRAHQESKGASEVRDFVLGVIDPPEPVASRERRLALVETPGRDALLSRIRAIEDPVLRSRLLLAAGNHLLSSDGELESLREARDSIVSLLGADSVKAIEADESLAQAYAVVGRIPEGEQLLNGALGRRRRLFGRDHPDTWRATSQLAFIHKLGRNHDRAAPLFEAAIAGLEPSLGPDDSDVLSMKVGLSGSYLELRSYREAQALLENVIVRIRRVHGERAFQTCVALYNLACAEANLGQTDFALGHLREAIELGWNYPFGPAHDPQLLPLHRDPRFDALDRAGRLNDGGFWSSHFFVAEERLRERRFAEAEPMFRDLVAAADRLEGREADVRARLARLALAKCRIRQGRFDEAEGVLLPMLANGGKWWRIYDLLAQCEMGRGRRESALARIAEGIAVTGTEFEHVEILYLEAERDALQGRDQAALRILAQAAELGLEDADRLENDLAFVKLRPRAEFKEVVRSVRAHAL